MHILNPDGDYSPSAFIPFCIFGNNMNNLGQKIDDFDVPVCNVFVATNWNDRVCYELDLNLLKHKDDINNQLKDGLLLVLDFNEERQFEKNIELVKDAKIRNYFYEDKENSVQVYIDSIGENKKYTKLMFLTPTGVQGVTMSVCPSVRPSVRDKFV